MAKKKKAKKKSSWMTKLFLCFVVYFAIVFAVQQGDINNMNAEAERLQERLNELERNNQEMAQQAEIINSNEYIEYLVRLKLGWVKADEMELVGIGKD